MVSLIKNLDLNNFTSFAGSCKVKKILSSEKLKTFLDTNLNKRSGEKMSEIFSHLVCKTITQTKSVAKLTRLSDPILQPISDRTTIGRQIDKFAPISTQILKFFISEKFLNGGDLLIILDSTLLKAEGKTYQNAIKLYDHNKNQYYYGYQVCSFILSNGKEFYPYKFIINDESKTSILEILEEMKSLFKTNKVSFDAGFKGNEFFEELDKRGFLFYTKATRNWYFNYGKDYKAEEHLKSMQAQDSIYNEREVFRENLRFRLVSRKNDNRLILTNDFSCSIRKAFGKYVQRWDVETFFKEAKETLLLQRFIRRKTYDSIISHITIIFTSFSILMQLSGKLNLKVKGFQMFIETYIQIKALVRKNKQRFYLEISDLSKNVLKFFNLRIKFEGGQV